MRLRDGAIVVGGQIACGTGTGIGAGVSSVAHTNALDVGAGTGHNEDVGDARDRHLHKGAARGQGVGGGVTGVGHVGGGGGVMKPLRESGCEGKRTAIPRVTHQYRHDEHTAVCHK